MASHHEHHYFERAGRTAIASTAIPAPVRDWVRYWMHFSGRRIYRVIDWGCGKRDIIAALRLQGHEVAGIAVDPIHKPTTWHIRMFIQPAQVVFCTYVINVLPRDLAEQTVVEAWGLVAWGGELVLSWRDDLSPAWDTTHDMKARSCQRYISEDEIEDLIDLLPGVNHVRHSGKKGRYGQITLKKVVT